MNHSIGRICLFLISMITSMSLPSQGLIGGNTDVLSSMNGDLIYGGADYKGNPFLYDSWGSVTIIDMAGAEIEVKKAKYDVSSQKILAEKEGKEIWVNDYQISSFILTDPVGLSRTFVKSVEKDEIIYYELLLDGEFKLYKRYTKEFVKPRPTDTFNYGSSGDVKAYFKDLEEDLLVQYKDYEITKIKANGKGIEDAFPKSLQRSAKSFTKRNKPKASNIAELKEYITDLAASMNKD